MFGLIGLIGHILAQMKIFLMDVGGISTHQMETGITSFIQ